MSLLRSPPDKIGGSQQRITRQTSKTNQSGEHGEIEKNVGHAVKATRNNNPMEPVSAHGVSTALSMPELSSAKLYQTPSSNFEVTGKRKRLEGDIFFGENSTIEIACDEINKKMESMCSFIEKYEASLCNINANIQSLLDERSFIREELSSLKSVYSAILEKLNHVPPPDQSTSVSNSLSSLPNVMSYSEIVQQPSTSTNAINTQPKSSSKHVVIVKPKDSTQESKVTFSEVRKKINPVDKDIRKVKNVNNGGIVIECGSKSDANDLIKEMEQHLGDNYQARAPEKRNPKIRAFGLRELYTADIIEQSLRTKNKEIFEDSSTIKVLHTFAAKKTELYGFQLEVDPLSFQKIVAVGKLKVLWEQCSVQEIVDVTRCYKCCGYHHVAKNCTGKTCCSKCGDEHRYTECQSSVESCNNCKLSNEELQTNYDVNHSATSVDCSVYKRQVNLNRKKVNYGSP